MPNKDHKVAAPRGKAPWRKKAAVPASILAIAAAFVMFALGFLFGSQILSECRDPGGCTEKQVFVVAEGGVPNSAGLLLISGSGLLIVGIIVLLLQLRLKHARETG